MGGADLPPKGQAATEEQLETETSEPEDHLGWWGANDKGNVTTSNIGETGADNVHDAIKSVKETAEKGWKLKANDKPTAKIAAGDTVTMKQVEHPSETQRQDLTVRKLPDGVEFDHVKADSVAATSVVAESVYRRQQRLDLPTV